MDMYTNKKFTDLINGKVVQVTDQFEDIVILDGKTKIKMNKLLDNNLYDEYIDPKNFFRNEGLVSAFTEKIRQISTDNISNEKDRYDPKNPPVLKNYGDPMRPSFDEPAVLPYDPEEEKRELIVKAQNMFKRGDNAVQRQMESLKSIIEEDTDDNFNNIDERFIENPQISQRPIEPQIRTENYMNNNNNSIDPIVQMFRNAKRNTDFKINFTINNKIPRLDFIEMMEDSYNTSIIDFLAEEFTNELLLNPEVIKNKIKDQISSMVYKSTQKVVPSTEVTKTTTRRKTTKSNDRPTTN
jgi:hypothetical protein